MAANNEYKLTIELVGGGGDTEGGTTTPTADNGGGKTPSAKEEQNNGGKQAVAIYHYAKNLASKYASHRVNTITLRTGFEEQQARAQLALNLGTRAWNVGESVIVGAMTTGSPYGALAGLVVGVATEAIDMSFTAQEVQYAKEVEATQLFLNSIRMGAGANRGGRQ